jgi:hypothetical protein
MRVLAGRRRGGCGHLRERSERPQVENGGNAERAGRGKQASAEQCG